MNLSVSCAELIFVIGSLLAFVDLVIFLLNSTSLDTVNAESQTTVINSDANETNDTFRIQMEDKDSGVP